MTECINHKWQIKGQDAEIRCRDCDATPALPHVVQNEMIRELQRIVLEIISREADRIGGLP